MILKKGKKKSRGSTDKKSLRNVNVECNVDNNDNISKPPCSDWLLGK
jgi:hypothetical protein